jgi:hypothetical protein
LITNLIRPESSAIEFGAGRQILKQHLPKSCKYTPSDIASRGLKNVLVCDLNNSNLPDFDTYDYAVFESVLEYANNVPNLVKHIANSANTIICPYAHMPLRPSVIFRSY